MRPIDRIEAFVNEAGGLIRWKSARSEVMEELREHIIDLRDLYIRQGFDEDAASVKAIEQTGSAKEIGRELNRANRPAPEWAKENVFLKSMLRQPLRSLLLFLLIGAAAFGFVLRTAEFVVVRDRIFEIAGFYRAIGFLRPEGAPVFEGVVNTADVLEAANLIANSEYLGFEDRRRGALGLLTDLRNFDAHVMDGDWGMEFLEGIESPPLNQPGGVPHAYFYAELVTIFGRLPRIRVIIDEVIVGYPEHVWPGREMLLRFPGEPGQMRDWPVAGMEVGGRYLLKAYRHVQILHEQIPYAVNSDEWSRIFVATSTDPYNMWYHYLFHYSELTLLPLNDDGLWFMPVPYREADFTLPELVGLPESIAFLERNHREMQIRTTRDMTAMPITQEGFNMLNLMRGRFLNNQDYLEARPVAVIHEAFAVNRGLSVGDTFTISIPDNQQLSDIYGRTRVQGFTGPENIMHTILNVETLQDFVFTSDSREYLIHELELEVVGTFSFFAEFDPETWWSTFVYIPDSLLPSDFMAANYLDFSDRYNYLFDHNYSFVIADPRNEDAFTRENSEALERLGFALTIFPNDADNFWASAYPMLQAITVNFAVFLIVLLLVIGLVVFLYLHQRRREMAISRVLGMPVKRMTWRVCIPLCVVGLPAIVIGGAVGFTLSLRQSAATVSALDELRPDLIADVELSVLWLALLLAAVSLLLFAFTVAAVTRNNRKSPLALLQGSVGQGTTGRRQKAERDEIAGQARNDGMGTFNDGMGTLNDGMGTLNDGQSTLAATQKTALPDMTADFVKVGKARHNAEFIFRHIARSRVKSALTVFVALFFVLALGYLQTAIYNSEREIDRLYDTTIVAAEIQSAELRARNPFIPLNNFILRQTAETALGFDFVINPYLEAAYQHFFVIAPDDYGNFPEDNLDDFWIEFWRHMHAVRGGDWFSEACPVFAVNDLGIFIEETERGGAFFELVDEARLELMENPLMAEFMGDVEPFEITFAEGFGMEDFVYSDPYLEAPIPVILSEFTMRRRGLSLGGTAFLGHDFSRFPRRLVYPLVIIGTHNGLGIPMLNNAVLMPVSAAHPMPIEPFGPTDPSVAYVTLRFDIDPAYNRDLDSVRSQIQEVIYFREQNALMELDIFMQDDELRLVVGQMEENLSLLRILQPIAIAFSIIIGAGLSLLLMLQNAKTAAIMRVLGTTKTHTRLTLCFENLVVCLAGAVIGLIAILLFGSYISAMLPLFAALYILGTIMGSALGAIMVSNRPPLDLLQVRE